jgi:hypothetical protein
MVTCRDGTGVAMKQASTQALFNYWNERRGRRPAPDRSDIDPGDIRHVLGDTFMLSADFADEIRFRLAGTRVCTLFAREIKGEAFNALWSEQNRKEIGDLLEALTSENIGAVAGVTGRTEDGAELELELLLLPLARTGQARIRALGALVPLARPYWLGEQPVVELELRTLRHIGTLQSEIQGPRFGQRIRRGFLVYNGGREEPFGNRAG